MGKNHVTKNRKRRGTGFIVMGLLFLTAALFLSGYNYWDSLRAGAASDEVLDEIIDAMRNDQENPDTDPSSTGAGAEADPYKYLNNPYDPDRPMETTEIKGYKYIGILEIPSLKISLPVMEEWDYTRLRIAPCRFSGSYYSDDLVIAGHNYSRHFSPIKGVDIGADVYFTNPSGEVFHYQVDYRETMQPTQVDEMIFDDADLTLFTCNTGGRTRCAVRCSRVDK